MKKLLIIFLVLCLTTTALSQYNPMLGRQVNISHQLSDFVVLCLYNEGSGGQVFDLSGNGNTGTFVADTAWIAGPYGSALIFDGLLDHLSFTTTSILQPSSFTVIGSVKPVNETKQVLFGWSTTTAHPVLWLNYTAGKPLMYLGSSNYRYFTAASWNLLADGNEHIVAFTCPGSGQTDILNAKLYIDGVDQGNDGLDSTTGAQTAKSANLAYRSEEGDAYKGTSSFLLMYDRVLSDSEIALLYREPFCFIEGDMSVAQMYSYGPVAPPAVVPTPYYYRGLVPLPLIFFTVYCYFRRWKCAA